MSAVHQFYDKLIQLPLDEKAPALLSHYLITASTLEQVRKPSHIRAKKNGFILQDVIETVQRRPDMLDDFCSLLQDMAEELAQQIKGMLISPRMQFTEMRSYTVLGSVGIIFLR